MWELMVQTAGILATPTLILSYIPQIISLIKTKNAEGISLSFWFILDLSLLFLFILAMGTFLNTGVASLAIAQGANLALAVVNTALVIYYKNKGVKRISLLGIGDSV